MVEHDRTYRVNGHEKGTLKNRFKQQVHSLTSLFNASDLLNKINCINKKFKKYERDSESLR